MSKEDTVKIVCIEANLHNEKIFDIIENFENKILERGLINEYVGCFSFDFSIHIADIGGHYYLAVDIFSDVEEFRFENILFEDVFAVVIGGLEEREFFGELSTSIDKPLNTDHLICMCSGEFMKKIAFV